MRRVSDLKNGRFGEKVFNATQTPSSIKTCRLIDHLLAQALAFWTPKCTPHFFRAKKWTGVNLSVDRLLKLAYAEAVFNASLIL